MPKKFVEKKNSKKKFLFCENEKLDYPRFLGHFYYHGTIDLPCISKPTSIRNWVTFCVFIVLGIYNFDLNLSMCSYDNGESPTFAGLQKKVLEFMFLFLEEEEIKCTF